MTKPISREQKISRAQLTCTRPNNPPDPNSLGFGRWGLILPNNSLSSDITSFSIKLIEFVCSSLMKIFKSEFLRLFVYVIRVKKKLSAIFEMDRIQLLEWIWVNKYTIKIARRRNFKFFRLKKRYFPLFWVHFAGTFGAPWDQAFLSQTKTKLKFRPRTMARIVAARVA
jgi:hypothetical protein